MRLVLGDIQEALAWFKEQKRQEAVLVIPNKKNEPLAKEANDIKFEYLGGV